MIWTTKKGKEIEIKHMTDTHLANAIRFIERKIDSYPGYQTYVGNSEYAEDAVEAENRANEEHLYDLQFYLKEMKAEQRRRVRFE